jgi:hypothetical protein
MIEPNRAVTVEPLNPSSPSLGPDPLTFWNKVMPFSSNRQISDPRSIAIPITVCLLLRLHACTICACSLLISGILSGQYSIDAGAADPQPYGNFRGGVAGVLQSDDLSAIPSRWRSTMRLAR